MNELAESSFFIKGNNYSIEIISVSSPKQEQIGISTVSLGDCDGILKKYYNLTDNENLVISKLDEFNSSSIIPNVKYNIYDSKGKNLITQYVIRYQFLILY